ncbi:MAG TPA: hypothetical protein DD638_00330 [Pasteurellaceae bacterium]|nr:hypothetical protein [Pasteurellaceae bacterium]
MKLEKNTEFSRYVAKLFVQYKDKRIHQFTYQNQLFWLKQPDQLQGVWKLLKPNPRQALQHEIRQLQEMNAKNAPVVKLVLFDQDFFVSEDAGRTANLWVEDKTVDDTFKQQVLNDCADALAELHKKGFIHGRPALRDMAWHEGKVTFLDFEEHKDKKNLQWQKVRDCLIFIHGFCRSKSVSTQQMGDTITYFQQCCEPEVWQQMLKTVVKYRWLYYLLLPFKPIAKMDLIAAYKLFENLLPQAKRSVG